MCLLSILNTYVYRRFPGETPRPQTNESSGEGKDPSDRTEDESAHSVWTVGSGLPWVEGVEMFFWFDGFRNEVVYDWEEDSSEDKGSFYKSSQVQQCYLSVSVPTNICRL